MSDVAINPKTPIVNGAAVSTANPLPTTVSTTSGGATNVYINPIIWVVNGAIVSASNPLPITMS